MSGGIRIIGELLRGIQYSTRLLYFLWIIIIGKNYRKKSNQELRATIVSLGLILIFSYIISNIYKRSFYKTSGTP